MVSGFGMSAYPSVFVVFIAYIIALNSACPIILYGCTDRSNPFRSRSTMFTGS